MERNKVDEKYKWKLEDLYSSIEEYNKDIEVLGKLVEEFITYEGRVTNDDKTLLHALLLQEKIDRITNKLYVFINMRLHEDTRVGKYQELAGNLDIILSVVNEKTAFFIPELLECSYEKIKEKFFKDAIEEYLRRISKYSKIEIIEVNDVDLNNKDLNLGKEKESLLKYINDKDYIVTLEIEGKQMSSEEFSQTIDKTLIDYPNITFIIGGSYGIHNDIKNKSNLKLSFSKMTFPHQLFRIILLEQIYRGFKIIKNESYHK